MDAVDAKAPRDTPPVEVKDTPQGISILNVNDHDKWFVVRPGTLGDMNLIRVLNTNGEPGKENSKMYEVTTNKGKLLSLVVYENVSKTTDLTRPINNATSQVLVKDGQVVTEDKQDGLLRGYRDAIAPSLQQLQLDHQLDMLGPDFKASLTAPYKN